MPSSCRSARPLVLRRLAEPSRDQHLLLAHVYDHLLRLPLLSAVAVPSGPSADLSVPNPVLFAKEILS